MRRIFFFAIDFFRLYTKWRASRSAAEFAYFLTLSIFPLLILGIAVLASFELSIETFLHEAWARDVVNAIFDYTEHIAGTPSVALLFSSVLVVLTSGSAAFRSILKLMEDIQGRAPNRGIFGFVFSVLFALSLLFVLYFSVFIITFGAMLMEFLEETLGIGGLLLFWNRIRFLLLFVLGSLVVYWMYRFTAPKKPNYSRLPGAVLATLALVIGTMFFGYFVGQSARYPLLYGSLASFILLMVWTYLCGNILICGNLFNFLLYERKNTKMLTCESEKTVVE